MSTEKFDPSLERVNKALSAELQCDPHGLLVKYLVTAHFCFVYVHPLCSKDPCHFPLWLNQKQVQNCARLEALNGTLGSTAMYLLRKKAEGMKSYGLKYPLETKITESLKC